IHYVPKKTVDATFDAGRDAAGNGLQKPWPGARDTLTREMVDALNQEGGTIFVNHPQTLTDLSPVCVFTLPDKVGWSAYVVVGLPEVESATTTPLHCVIDATARRTL